MQFQVPQFIEVEDKLFGPFTIKQFIYMFGTAGFVFILYTMLPLFLTIFIGAPIAVFGLALAFFKVNNRPFILMVEAAFLFISTPRLYVWKKVPRKIVQKTEEKVSDDSYVPRLSDSKLKELAWSLDIQENTSRNKSYQL
jgi:hypothetical protein